MVEQHTWRRKMKKNDTKTNAELEPQDHSELKYRTLFENTGTAMVTIGPDSTILRCNTQFSRLAEYSVREIVGEMKWTDFVAAKDLGRMKEYHEQRSYESHLLPGSYTFAFVSRTGLHKKIQLFVQLIPKSAERICSLIDITEREEMLAALRESKERYALIAKGANDGFWDWDINTNEVWYSQRYRDILGYSEEEFPDSADSWLKTIHPEDFEYAMSANQRCLDGEIKQFEVEYRMFHKDGTIRWILGRGAGMRDKDGNVYRMAGTHTDITLRKLNERTMHALYAISSAVSTTQDLRELYETIHCIIDEAIDAENFFIVLLNEQTDSFEFVYFSDERDDYYTIPNISDPQKNSLSIHVFRTGAPLLLSSSDPEFLNRMKRIGIFGTVPTSWLGVPLRLRGATVGTMAVQDYDNPNHYTDADVTFMTAVSEQVALAIERKRNEEELELMVNQRTRELSEKAAELEEANARLMELDKVKSSLISSISHELRTPLTSIRGFAKLCSRDFIRYFSELTDSPTAKAKANRIRNNLAIIDMEGTRLTRLINDFLDINRIESGKASWHDQFIDPCEVIKKAVSAASGSFAANTAVKIRVNLPETCTPIHADPDKIQQVVINLLNNAYKFTRKGSVTISLIEGPETLTTSVCDTGSGIPAKEIPHLFEKFHKSTQSDTVTNENKGTGLGLTICKEIIEHYEGAIWVESTLGQGSCFFFTLPTVRE